MKITFKKEDMVKLVDNDNHEIISALIADGWSTDDVVKTETQEIPRRGRPKKLEE